jgi:hypothetical protein
MDRFQDGNARRTLSASSPCPSVVATPARLIEGSASSWMRCASGSLRDGRRAPSTVTTDRHGRGGEHTHERKPSMAKTAGRRDRVRSRRVVFPAIGTSHT